MPSPVGHALAGLTVAELLGPSASRRLRCTLIACAADADVLAGLFDGAPASKHARATHSLAAAAAVSVSAGLWRWMDGHRFGRATVEAAAAYGSHLLLDYLGKKDGEGMELFWPFSQRRTASEHAWFATITSGSKRGGFWKGLLSRHNARAMAREGASLLPLWWAARRIRRAVSRPAPRLR